MKIEVSDDLFKDLAKDLHTTQENVVKIFLDHAKDLPHTIKLDAVQEGNSLDSALEKLMRNAEPAFNMGEIIEKIVGDHDYEIDESGYDFEKGIIWFHVAFYGGDNSELDAIHLQFGDDAGVIVQSSINKITLTKDMEEIEEEIYDAMYSYVDEDDQGNFHYDWLKDDFLTFDIQIDTENTLDLPKVSDMDKMVRKIKKIIRKYDDANSLK